MSQRDQPLHSLKDFCSPDILLQITQLFRLARKYGKVAFDDIYIDYRFDNDELFLPPNPLMKGQKLISSNLGEVSHQHCWFRRNAESPEVLSMAGALIHGRSSSGNGDSSVESVVTIHRDEILRKISKQLETIETKKVPELAQDAQFLSALDPKAIGEEMKTQYDALVKKQADRRENAAAASLKEANDRPGRNKELFKQILAEGGAGVKVSPRGGKAAVSA